MSIENATCEARRRARPVGRHSTEPPFQTAGEPIEGWRVALMMGVVIRRHLPNVDRRDAWHPALTRMLSVCDRVACSKGLKGDAGCR